MTDFIRPLPLLFEFHKYMVPYAMASASHSDGRWSLLWIFKICLQLAMLFIFLKLGNYYWLFLLQILVLKCGSELLLLLQKSLSLVLSFLLHLPFFLFLMWYLLLVSFVVFHSFVDIYCHCWVSWVNNFDFLWLNLLIGTMYNSVYIN